MEVFCLKGRCRNAEKVEGCIPAAQGTHLGMERAVLYWERISVIKKYLTEYLEMNST